MRRYTVYLGIVDTKSVGALRYALIKEKVDHALLFSEHKNFEKVHSKIKKLMDEFPEITFKKVERNEFWGIITEMLNEIVTWLSDLKSNMPPYSKLALLFDITGGGKIISLALHLIASLFERNVTVVFYTRSLEKKAKFERKTLPQLKPITLAPQKFIILYTLSKCKKPIKTLSALGKKVVSIGNYQEYEKISVSNLSRHVTELERLGFLVCIRKRKKTIYLTEKGEAYLKYYELKQKLERIV